MQARVVLRDSVRATDKIFDYRIPSHLEGVIAAGHFVEVPFGAGNRIEIALVLEVTEDFPTEFTIKEIRSIKDPEIVMNPDQIALLPYVRSRYTCTYGDAVRLMVPSVVTTRCERVQNAVDIVDRDLVIALLEEDEIQSLQQLRVLEYLVSYGATPVTELMIALSVSRSPIDTLRKRGLLYNLKMACRVDKESDESIAQVAPTDPHPPSDAQKTAIEKILDPQAKREFLLFGVTGSGKTEVYLQCASKVLEDGGSVLFLVPEISLTPQMVNWIRSRFPGMTAVLHSRLTPRERYEQWDAIRKGKARIVVGARSAVFAPLQNLRLILIDEEQDSSYKSETHPRYHAKDIARRRANLTGAALVLGSATPSIESYYAAINGYSNLLTLPERIADQGLPTTEMIDMREELRHKNRSVISRRLHDAITTALDKDEQVILFLNKRGYASMLLCRACGESFMCPHCSVAMTVHTSKRSQRSTLICHYCGRVDKVPEACPACGSKVHGKFGLGTEQLEEWIRKEFPGSNVIRMDQDTTVGRDAHERILTEFREKRASILVGTQMIAKGHDFPDVTVVGIIAADLLLRTADYRASERTFQLVTQAAGRAGRGDKAGRVFIQTYQPEDDTLLFAAKQDYEAFFENEIIYRQRLGYPPFLAIGSVLISHVDEKTAVAAARKLKSNLADSLREESMPQGVEIFGPSPAGLYRVKDRYRYVINIKARRKSDLALLFAKISDNPPENDVRIGMDIDPIW